MMKCPMCGRELLVSRRLFYLNSGDVIVVSMSCSCGYHSESVLGFGTSPSTFEFSLDDNAVVVLSKNADVLIGGVKIDHPVGVMDVPSFADRVRSMFGKQLREVPSNYVHVYDPSGASGIIQKTE